MATVHNYYCIEILFLSRRGQHELPQRRSLGLHEQPPKHANDEGMDNQPNEQNNNRTRSTLGVSTKETTRKFPIDLKL